ncbi:prephenate dehydratase [Arthrobacter sp. zg-Y820]|uniref:prephenate dehydratase n=1 Tax=unclassified Arthrobacter TaxID=235627 RepID=UPI001E4E268B|nr:MULTISPECIES: prephenate dehydratase [unclassified Arthrobacter]MCC9197437.1 prephenate dehydratase [Arthrobacter sp. zg-Y820]MDK1280304.1 prephenate dehydratase [Arthrobacter sp. zg.Y820]MDK1360559.1 prephenate dehydratase [Arthrobacter sp. zg-Y1219]WIB09591.1 prephenate dehydratase [Arthrobacter sp. zg-Y820]
MSASPSTGAGSETEGLIYTYLGPEGTFTEAALLQVPGADASERIPATSVNTALEMVRSGRADAAVVPIENSVEGGVSATLDAISAGDALRIRREILVPITFVLAARPGLDLAGITTVSTHSHAWAQCRNWAEINIPQAEYLPASSTAAAATGLLSPGAGYDAAICSPLVAERLGLNVIRTDIGDVADAVTRFVLLSRPAALPAPTGADKTTLVVPLPEDHPGALMEILDQFSARGVNLSRIESRPTGLFLGDYFFSIDADGHINDARMADALKGLHRISPNLRFLGSYPRADHREPEIPKHTSDEAFRSADRWLQGLLDG